MNYFVKVTENGTEKIIIIDSYSQPAPVNPIDAIVNRHIGQTDNPHQTDLQQTITKQGITPVQGTVRFGTNNYNDEMLTILKSAIYMVLNGDLRTTSFDVNGFYHTTRDGLNVFIDNGGVRLYNGVNTITVNYDGTITGLQDCQLAHSAVTKAYVDTLALGLKPHPPVKLMLEKTVDINTFTANGRGVGKTLTASQNGTFFYQGVSCEIGDRIGVMCYGYQRLDAGIYTITDMGSSTKPWVLTRASDFDGSPSAESKQADVLFVQEGRFAKYMFIETEKGSEPNSGYLVIDSDLVSWEIFHKPQDYVFDQGLQLDGQTVSVKPDITTGESVIPVMVSPNGVGVQKAIFISIAEAKKQEAESYTDLQIQAAKAYTDQAKTDAINQSNSHSEFLKSASDQALQNFYAQTVTNDNTLRSDLVNYAVSLSVGNEQYTNTQIQQAKAYSDQTKADAISQSKSYADGLKTASDQALQASYQQTQTNDQAVQTAAKNYTDQQITSLAATIPTGSSKPMIYPQFFLLNGGTIQNYSDYLYMDNAYRSGNDAGLNSNNCIPFLIPEAATLIGLTVYIGAVAVAGTYVANTNAAVNFEIRNILPNSADLLSTFSTNVSGAAGTIGSNGNFPASSQAFAGGVTGLNIALTKGFLIGIKFKNNTTGSAVIASAIKNVVIKLEIRVG